MKDIWIPLSGAIAQYKNVETIANNIANANTPGFKKDQHVFKEYLTILNKGSTLIDLPIKEWRPEDFYRTQGSEHGLVASDGNYTIFEQGPLTPTANPLDLALQGPGFFEVLGPNGIRYTRKGNLSLSKDGILVTDQGFQVLAKVDPSVLKDKNIDPKSLPPQPDERIIKVENGKFTVNLQGEVFSNGKKISDLSIVEFNDLNTLLKEGNSLFINQENDNINSNENSTSVYQGFMEGSNVNPITEMSALIKANRHFETIQKAIKAYDDIAGKSVNEISKF